VLSETALVLVIESSLQWCYVRSTRDLALNAIKLFSLSTDEHEHEHEYETCPESESYWPLFSSIAVKVFSSIAWQVSH
jgi:hypothetical protein